MKWFRLVEQPRLLTVLALAFSLLPAGLAVLTYRDAWRKDERVFETTARVLAEHLQTQFERHTYLPADLKRAALTTRGRSCAASRPQAKAMRFISTAAPLSSIARISASSEIGTNPCCQA